MSSVAFGCLWRSQQPLASRRCHHNISISNVVARLLSLSGHNQHPANGQTKPFLRRGGPRATSSSIACVDAFSHVDAIGGSPTMNHQHRLSCMMKRRVVDVSVSVSVYSATAAGWRRCAPFGADLVAVSPKRRHFSNSSNGPSCHGTRGDDGQDHHAFFQEQLRELEQERTSLLGKDGGAHDHDDETPLETGTFTAKAPTIKASTSSSSSSSSSPPPARHSVPDQEDRLEMLEEMKQDRELLYQFTTQEVAAWGKRRRSDEGSLQQVLAEVAKARQRMVAAEAVAAAAAASSSSSSYVRDDDDVDDDNPRKSGGDNDDTAWDDRNNGRGGVTSSSAHLIIGSDDDATSGPHGTFFSHVTGDGNNIHMVDVGGKAVTARMAHARSKVVLPPDVMRAFGITTKTSTTSPSSTRVETEIVGPKGPIFAAARLAGIMAAKRTSDLIPLCHPLPLDQVQIDIRLERMLMLHHNDGLHGVVTIDCICRVTHKTGVEMEALTGATIAALTIYDMTKAVSHEIEIVETRLVAKTGGRRSVPSAPPPTER